MKRQSKRTSGKKLYEQHAHAIDSVAKFMAMESQKVATGLSKNLRKH